MDLIDDNDRESILKFLSKQTVFITGGTGFIGKALVFKLLQCRVKRIFLLIRPKKGKLVQERLDSILKEEIFESLYNKDADIMKRVIPIAGDVTQLRCGISDEDRTMIQNEVTIVINGAASVKFDDPLKQAVITNLRSTREMVELAKGIKNLIMFHFISTAYSNSDHMCTPSGIKEEIYDRKMDWRKLIEFVETAPDELIDTVTNKILGMSVNTYIFTKHLAEAIIQDAAQEIPIMISRPPIIISSIKEPIPGWLDNISSPVAIIAAAGKGVLRLYLGTRYAIKAYMPVDTCIDCIITSTWKEIALRPDHGSKVAVYNMEFTSITTDRIHQTCAQLNTIFPMSNALWYLHFYAINSSDLFLLLHILFHFFPGLLFDGVLLLSGQKTRLTRLYRKLYVTLLSLYPVINLDDKFQYENYLALKTSIPESEKVHFSLDKMDDGDDEEALRYMSAGSMGFRKLIGDPPTPSKKDFLHNKRLYWLDKAFFAICAALFLWMAPYGFIFYPLVYIYSSIVNFYNSI